MWEKIRVCKCINQSVCFNESLPGITYRPLHLHPGKIQPAELNWLKLPLTVPAEQPAASVTTPAVPIQPAAAVPVTKKEDFLKLSNQTLHQIHFSMFDLTIGQHTQIINPCLGK